LFDREAGQAHWQCNCSFICTGVDAAGAHITGIAVDVGSDFSNGWNTWQLSGSYVVRHKVQICSRFVYVPGGVGCGGGVNTEGVGFATNNCLPCSQVTMGGDYGIFADE